MCYTSIWGHSFYYSSNKERATLKRRKWILRQRLTVILTFCFKSDWHHLTSPLLSMLERSPVMQEFHWHLGHLKKGSSYLFLPILSVFLEAQNTSSCKFSSIKPFDTFRSPFPTCAEWCGSEVVHLISIFSLPSSSDSQCVVPQKAAGAPLRTCQKFSLPTPYLLNQKLGQWRPGICVLMKPPGFGGILPNTKVWEPLSRATWSRWKAPNSHCVPGHWTASLVPDWSSNSLSRMGGSLVPLPI